MVKKIVCLIAFVMLSLCSVNVYAQTDSDCTAHRYNWERGEIYWSGTPSNLLSAGLEACYEIDYGVCNINGNTLRLRNTVGNTIWVVFTETRNSRTIRLSPGETTRVPFDNIAYGGTIRVEVRWCATPVSSNVISLGDSITRYLRHGYYTRYGLYIPSYQTVVFDLRGSFDTVIRVYDRNLTLLYENDDSPEGGLNSLIRANLPAGNYIVEVNSFSGSDGGDYTLSIF